jgi:hypothetical protein
VSLLKAQLALAALAELQTGDREVAAKLLTELARQVVRLGHLSDGRRWRTLRRAAAIAAEASDARGSSISAAECHGYLAADYAR